MKALRYSVIFSLALFLVACGGEEQKEGEAEQEVQEAPQEIDKPVVTEAIIKKSNFNKTVEVHGFVMSGNNILVIPEANGVIRQISVKEGQTVTKGTVLARIDTDLMYKNMQEMEKQLELAQQLFEKQKSLYESNVGSEIQYLQAKNNKESLEQRIQTIKTQIGKAVVRAPISGKIDKIYPKQGEMASMQQPLLRIINTKVGAYVECDVSEAYYRSIDDGDAIEIKFPTFGDEAVPAKITYKSDFINNSNRTFKIQANLDTKSKDYPANLFALVTLTLSSDTGVVVIPTDVIQKSGADNIVYVVTKDDKGQDVASKRVIEISKSSDNKSLISKGLKAGDRIISKAVSAKLSDGIPVIVGE